MQQNLLKLPQFNQLGTRNLLSSGEVKAMTIRRGTHLSYTTAFRGWHSNSYLPMHTAYILKSSTQYNSQSSNTADLRLNLVFCQLISVPVMKLDSHLFPNEYRQLLRIHHFLHQY